MIAISRLREFGFEGADKFPQHLSRHTVTLSLPSAISNGLDPLEVVIEDGLVIPQQAPGSGGGMIIKNDGTMLYIAHEDEKDTSSPLRSRFVKDIPYDARVDACQVMRRAVKADPSLMAIWSKVIDAWTLWFPLMDGAGSSLPAGEFKSMSAAWNRMADLFGRLIEQVSRNQAELESARVKVIVQSGQEYKKGWQGEENVVDEVLLKAVVRMDLTKYLLQQLFPKLQDVLRDPVFSSASYFHVYYGSRRSYMIKLVIDPLPDQFPATTSSAGIEFTLSDLL